MNRAGQDPKGKFDVKSDPTGGRQRFWERKKGAPTPATKYMKRVSFDFGDEWQMELEQSDESLERTPEQRMALALIAETLDDFRRYLFERPGNGQRLWNEAYSYIFVWRDLDYPYAFDNLCEHLKMNPDEIRRRLALWMTRQRLIAVKNTNRGSRGLSTSAPAADVGLDTAGVAA